MSLDTPSIATASTPAGLAFLTRRSERQAAQPSNASSATALPTPGDSMRAQSPTFPIDHPCPLANLGLSQGVSGKQSPRLAATLAPEQIRTAVLPDEQAPTWSFDNLNRLPTPPPMAPTPPLQDARPAHTGNTAPLSATAEGSTTTWRAAQLAITRTGLELAGGALTYGYLLPLCPTLPTVGVGILGVAVLATAAESVPNKLCSAVLFGAAYLSQGALFCLLLPGVATAPLATLAAAIGASLAACAAIMLGVSTLSTQHRDELQRLTQTAEYNKATFALNVVANVCVASARLFPMSSGGQAAALIGMVGAGVPAVALMLLRGMNTVTGPDTKQPNMSAPVHFAVFLGTKMAAVSWPAVLRAL